MLVVWQQMLSGLASRPDYAMLTPRCAGFGFRVLNHDDSHCGL